MVLVAYTGESTKATVLNFRIEQLFHHAALDRASNSLFHVTLLYCASSFILRPFSYNFQNWQNIKIGSCTCNVECTVNSWPKSLGQLFGRVLWSSFWGHKICHNYSRVFSSTRLATVGIYTWINLNTSGFSLIDLKIKPISTKTHLF